jgi:hypothetical protein
MIMFVVERQEETRIFVEHFSDLLSVWRMNASCFHNNIHDACARGNVLYRQGASRPGEVVVARDPDLGKVGLHGFRSHKREPKVDAVLRELAWERSVEDYTHYD